tara:strand:- start:5281 stop:5976 length:696 start_codon:yes stop_codon:yes gene_type:complete
MINVDRIYQRVLTLANKEQRGYITPQEFNIFANQAQMDIFEQYFYDLNQFRRTPGNDTMHADMVDILEEKISVFEATNPLTLTNGVGALGAFGNFYRLTSVRDGNIFFESVTRKEARLFQLSPLASPTGTRPVYTLDQANHRVRVFGRTPLTVDVDYIRIPLRVNWTYIVVGEKALYNETAIDAQNFELHPSEETELVLKILTLAGFTLKDPNLLQLAAGEDMKNIQQEKQ